MQRFFCAQAALTQQRRQRFPFHVFQNQIEAAILQATEVRGLRDVGVIDAPGSNRLALETSDRLELLGHFPMQHLQCHLFLHVHVQRAIHIAHATLPNTLDHLIALGNQPPMQG